MTSLQITIQTANITYQILKHSKLHVKNFYRRLQLIIPKA